MTDSDDTDCLLMIPPDLHINIAEEQILQQYNNKYLEQHINNMQRTQNHNELSTQNLSLHNTHMAQRDLEFILPVNSDISSISNDHRHAPRDGTQPERLLCSTPKTKQLQLSNYIAEDGHMQDVCYEEKTSFHCCYTSPKAKANVSEVVKPAVKVDLQKMSLSDMWQDEEQLSQPSVINLKEEQLRRIHLQKTVQALQARLLEYQQRLSVAIEVDRCKNEAISVANSEAANLRAELKSYKDKFEKLSAEHGTCEGNIKMLQKELSQSVGLVAKFESKNEKLQKELDSIKDKHKSQMDELTEQFESLNVKYQVSKRTEENAMNDIDKLRDKLVRVEHQCDKYKTRCADLEQEAQTLLQQKNSLQDFHEKQKVRADLLEDKANSLQDAITKLRETEATLLRKGDSQKKALKAEYQQQLENVVTNKLKDFQNELDNKEKTLKAEAKEREREIAAKAVNHLQMMHEKSEQEIMLLQQKHNEEVELYRLQLENSSKRIDKLEDYLNSYKSRRTEIAEQLHDVMETQWQKALEILISPKRSEQSSSQETDTSENNSSEMKTGTTVKVSTPKCKENNFDDVLDWNDSVERRDTLYQKILENHRISHFVNPSVSPEQADRLQSYIDLCLSKSPQELEKLERLLVMTEGDKHKDCLKNKSAKSCKNKRNNKPPWKA